MTRLAKISILVPMLLGVLSLPAGGTPLSLEECKALAHAPQRISFARIPALLEAMKELKTGRGEVALAWNEALEKKVPQTFDASTMPSKWHQFYNFLHLLQLHVKPDLPRIVEMDVAGAQKVLAATGVFDGTDILERIRSVTIDRTVTEDPRYVVRFAPGVSRMTLNGGKGHYYFTHGFCQHTTALLFYDEFAFSLRLNDDGNLLARYFRGVDFFGEFGVRGLFDIDFNYVSILGVKFFHGSPLGEVTATMSPEEFKKNEHNALLRIVTKFAKNSSLQPLGW